MPSLCIDVATTYGARWIILWCNNSINTLEMTDSKLIMKKKLQYFRNRSSSIVIVSQTETFASERSFVRLCPPCAPPLVPVRCVHRRHPYAHRRHRSIADYCHAGMRPPTASGMKTAAGARPGTQMSGIIMPAAAVPTATPLVTAVRPLTQQGLGALSGPPVERATEHRIASRRRGQNVLRNVRFATKSTNSTQKQARSTDE